MGSWITKSSCKANFSCLWRRCWHLNWQNGLSLWMLAGNQRGWDELPMNGRRMNLHQLPGEEYHLQGPQPPWWSLIWPTGCWAMSVLLLESLFSKATSKSFYWSFGQGSCLQMHGSFFIPIYVSFAAQIFRLYLKPVRKVALTFQMFVSSAWTSRSSRSP